MRYSFRASLLTIFFALFFANLLHAADGGVNYLEPKAFTGKIYSDASLKRVLFTFRRTATNSGSAIHVVRDFNLPNGTLAARELVEYDGNQLKSLVLEEFQAGADGTAKVESMGGESKINFNYTAGSTKKTGSEKYLDEILTSDMVGPFIAAHFEEIAKGEVVKCRLISVSRAETVGFKFIKEADITWNGKPALRITLQPSSIVIAHLVDALHFVGGERRHASRPGIHRAHHSEHSKKWEMGRPRRGDGV